MPNPPVPKRRARFQIHLSTAIVLMFVAGELIWGNVNGRRVEGRGYAGFRVFGNRSIDMTETEFLASERDFWNGKYIVEHGWPFNEMQTSIEVWIDRHGKMLMQSKPLHAEWRTGPLIYNALIALAILFGVWFLCEWLIRRRAARKRA